MARVVCPVKLTDRVWVPANGRPVVRAPEKPDAELDTPGRWESEYTATCQTGDCTWTHTGWPKVAIDEQARWHRQSHKAQG